MKYEVTKRKYVPNESTYAPPSSRFVHFTVKAKTINKARVLAEKRFKDYEIYQIRKAK